MATAMEDEIPKKYSSERHAKKILNVLNENRKLRPFCDGIVSIGRRLIFVQKCVLAAASHYFRLVFNCEACDSRSTPSQPTSCDVVDITSLGIEVSTFEMILDYIYTSDIRICDDNIQDILQAADLLLLVDLKALCCEYLEQCISPQNCLGIREFSSRYSCPWVHLKASMYLDDHFRDISHTEEFFRLQAMELKEILLRDCLHVHSEEDIFNSVIRWVRYEEMVRKKHLKDIIQSSIRVTLLSDHFIFGGLTEIMMDMTDIQEMVQEIRQTRAAEKCRGFTNVILMSGGEGQMKKGNNLEIKASMKFVIPSKRDNQCQGKWISMANMEKERIGHGLICVGEYLYAVGGRDDSCQILNTAEKYDPFINKWQPLSPMEHARVGFGLVAIDDNIYAIGGSNDMTEPLTSGEVHNVFKNKWKPIPDMNLKRVWSCYAAVDKKIYVMAGGSIGKLYEAVECYDTRTETWSAVSPMRERRCDARACTVGNDIYVFGGFRRIECPSAMHGGHSVKFCSTECYSTRHDTWTQVHTRGTNLCTMTDVSQILGAFYDGDEVMVVGNLEVGNGIQCIRAFNVHTNTWRAVVVNNPPQRGYATTLFRMPLYMLRELQWEQEKHAISSSSASSFSSTSSISS